MNYYYYFVEIRNRFFLLFVTMMSVIFTVYYYKEILLFILCLNNRSFSFIHTGITEIFYTYIKLIFFITNQVCFAYFFFHVIAFVIPGLYTNEQYVIITVFYTSIFTFVVTILFLNLILLPLNFEFFLSFQDNVTSKSLNFYFEARIEDYFYFFTSLYYKCHLYSQLFVFLLILFYYYDSKLEYIKLFRKLFYFLFCCFFSSIIFFSDIFTQILLFLYVIGLYELMVFCMFIKTTWWEIRFLINRQPLKTKSYTNYK